ncbi:MAG: hypothetical protein ACREA0_05580, partial [bacterium]
VQLMIDGLARNAGPDPPDPDDTIGDWALDCELRDEEVIFCRLGALLHDMGHLPAGHTLEDELGLLRPHDADERLNLILDRTTWFGSSHSPTLRNLIDDLYREHATAAGIEVLAGSMRSASEILCLLVSKDHATKTPSSTSGFRVNVCRDLIGNTICADLLDYLHRDWLHVGKPRYFDNRLLEYLELRTRATETGNDSRLVVNLRGGNRAVRTDGVTAILDLLESRYQLSEIALFHRTKLCAAAMLERALAELGDAYEDGRQELLYALPSQLLDRSDSEMLVLIDELLKAAFDRVSDDSDRKRIHGARELLRRLRIRCLHKEFVTAYEYKLADNALAVQQRYIGPADEEDKMERARKGAANRLRALRMLEADFALPPGSLVMYCPPRKMNTKIAEVQVLVHGDVHTLDGFERTHGDRGVTGGHLNAQQERFRRLWRMLIAIDPDERKRLRGIGLLQTLGRAVDLCVLGTPPSTGTLEEAVHSLAAELAARPSSPLHGRRVIELEAARSGALQYYPSGAPSLLSCTGDRDE